MIKVYFLNKDHREYKHWDRIGPFDNVTDAIQKIKKLRDKTHEVIPFDDYTFLAKSIVAHQIDFDLKFYDTELNGFVVIESPWKVGLND